MIALLTSLANMATGQIGTPLGIIAICVICVLGMLGVMGRGGLIFCIFFMVCYFSAPWIVQQISTVGV